MTGEVGMRARTNVTGGGEEEKERTDGRRGFHCDGCEARVYGPPTAIVVSSSVQRRYCQTCAPRVSIPLAEVPQGARSGDGQ